MNDWKLGKKIVAPVAEKPEWTPAGPGFEVNAKGHKRTVIPANEGANAQTPSQIFKGLDIAISGPFPVFDEDNV